MKIDKPTLTTMVTSRFGFINEMPVVENLNWILDLKNGQEIPGEKFGLWKLTGSTNFFGTLINSRTEIDLTPRDFIVLVDSETDFKERVAKLRA